METVPAYGYTLETFRIADEFVRHWYQSYSNQNFDRAQHIAHWMTDFLRAGKPIGFAHSMLIAACNNGGTYEGKRVW